MEPGGAAAPIGGEIRAPAPRLRLPRRSPCSRPLICACSTYASCSRATASCASPSLVR